MMKNTKYFIPETGLQRCSVGIDNSQLYGTRVAGTKPPSSCNASRYLVDTLIIITRLVDSLMYQLLSIRVVG